MDLNDAPYDEAASHRSKGPFPYAKWLDLEEVTAAQALMEVLPGRDYSSVVEISKGSGDRWAAWVFLEVALPDKPGRHVVVAVPPDGSASDAFSYVVLARPERTRPQRRQ